MRTILDWFMMRFNNRVIVTKEAVQKSEPSLRLIYIDHKTNRQSWIDFGSRIRPMILGQLRHLAFHRPLSEDYFKNLNTYTEFHSF